MPITKYTLPTYQPVGPVNVYLVLNPPYTLIDAGPNNPTAQSILIEDLQAKGFIDKLERIILTHAHNDHAGLADTMLKLTGAEIWIHELELNNAQNGYWMKAKEMLSKFGLSGNELRYLIKEFENRIRQHQNLIIPNANILRGGEKFVFKDFELTVLHLPGHSPGGICLYDEHSGTLFSGDLVLPNITPNALMELDDNGNCVPMARPLLNSLETLMRYDLNYVYPGHGQPFPNGESEARRIISNYQSKMAELDFLLSPGLQSIYTVAQKLYPNVTGFEFYLAISKTMGLVDLLALNGQVSFLERNGEIWIMKAT